MKVGAMARELGARGGLSRARRLSPEQRHAIASLGGAARRESFAAARRIADNFVYAEMAAALRGPASVVARVSTCDGPLPTLTPRKP